MTAGFSGIVFVLIVASSALLMLVSSLLAANNRHSKLHGLHLRAVIGAHWIVWASTAVAGTTFLLGVFTQVEQVFWWGVVTGPALMPASSFAQEELRRFRLVAAQQGVQGPTSPPSAGTRP